MSLLKNVYQSISSSMLSTFRLTLFIACLIHHPVGLANEAADQVKKEDSSPMVVFETSMGSFQVTLNADKAPLTVDNFIQYVSDGFYDGTIFHRVIDDFMVQGGGFDVDMIQKKPREQIVNEADNGLKNMVGSIAMARTNQPHSATSQFFINVKDNRFLNHRSKNPSGWGYAVFGEVTEGMEVINKIKKLRTSRKGGHQNVPVTAVVIEKAYLLNGQ